MKDRANGIALLSVVMALMVMTTVDAFSFGFSTQEADIVNLQTYKISDFGDTTDKENGIVWGAKFSSFAVPVTATDDESDYNRRPDPEVCNVAYAEGQPTGLPPEDEDDQIYCLGIKAQFIREGFNWVEVTPIYVGDAIASEDQLEGVVIYDETTSIDTEYGEATITNLDLFGVVESLDVWVWGGNYSWWLEFYVEDYEGYLHTLPAGDIKYVGWLNLRTTIPYYIPQSEGYVPFIQPLKLKLLKLWSYPTERIDQFFCYFDYLQVQTDVYWERFNGDDLAEGW